MENRKVNRINVVTRMLLLLMMVGGMVNETWGASRTYRYIVINKQNVVATFCDVSQEDGSAPSIPDIIKSPLVSTYYYWAQGAFTYSSSGGITEWTYSTYSNWISTTTPPLTGTYTLNEDVADYNSSSYKISTLSSANTTIFVTYNDYSTPQTVNGVEIDLNGGIPYNLMLTNTSYYLNYGSTDRPGLSNSTASLTTDDYLWTFTGNDPYNIKLHNNTKGSSYSVCTYFNSNQTGPNDGYYLGDNSTNNNTKYFTDSEAASQTHCRIQSFILINGTNSSFEFLGTDVRGMNIDKSDKMYGYPYLAPNNAGNNYPGMRAVWSGGSATNFMHEGTRIQWTLTPRISYDLTYTVVDGSGNKLATYTEPTGYSSGASATITIPSSLKRDNYCSAYTINSSADGTGTAYSENGTITMDADKTLYIRYTTNAAWSTLTNGTYYLWKPDGTNYTYATDATYANNGSAATRSTNDEYGWAFSGNPYSVTVTNKKYSVNTTTIATTSADAAFVTEEMIAEVTARFHVINKSGVEVLQHDVASQVPGSTITVPDAIKSPYATDYTMYGGYSSGFTGGAITEVPADANSDGVSDIYVDYTVNTSALTTDGIDLTGGTTYNLQVNSRYAYLDGTVQGSAEPADPGVFSYLWLLKSTSTSTPDPYDVKLYNRTTSATQQLSDTFILMKDDNNLNLQTATGNTTVNYLSCAADGNPVTTATVNTEGTVTLTQKYPTLTYHVVNLSGNVAITATATNQSSLSLPASITSPYVNITNYYLSDKTTTVTLATCGADVYVKYTVNTAALNQDGIDLGGTTNYNMLFSEDNYYLIRMEDGASNDTRRPRLFPSGTGDNSAKIENSGTYYNKTDGRALWNLKNSDPYNVQVYNVEYSHFYWGQTEDNTYTYLINDEGSATPIITSFILMRSASYTQESPYFELIAVYPAGGSTYRYATRGESTVPYITSTAAKATSALRRLKLEDPSLPADVTGYDKITVTIPATSYNADAGGPYMPKVKYNKTFPLVITSDDMGKTELTNNWAAFNGYPVIADWKDVSESPSGDDMLQVPYEPAYTYVYGKTANVADYLPMTYTDGADVAHRFTATSAIMPYAYGSGNNLVTADAQTMIRTGWSFAQHDVATIGSATIIAPQFKTNSDTQAAVTGIGLKVLVEPNGNHDYIAASKLNNELCWNIFQNGETGTYPETDAVIADWTTGNADWTTFSNKPDATTKRIFFQGNEEAFKSAIASADGTKIILGGTHGIGEEIRTYLKETVQPANNAWVASADEVWEYYHIYNNVKIENVSFSDGKLTFDVSVPRYKKHQFRELTINIPGLTGGGTNDGSVIFSGDATVVTGSYKGGTSNGFTLNFGLEDKILTYIDELETIYDANPANKFVQRDAKYLVDLLLPGSAAKTAYMAKDFYVNEPGSIEYAVKTRIGSEEQSTLISGKSSGAASLKYANPRYILKDGKLYEATANGDKPHYGGTFSFSSGATRYIDYTEKTDITGTAVFFGEAENMVNNQKYIYTHVSPTLTNSNKTYTAGIGSGEGGASIGTTNSDDITLNVTTLNKGRYKITTGIIDTNTGSDNYYYIKLNGTTVYTITSNTNATSTNVPTEYESDEIMITTDDTPVTITHNNTAGGNRCVDYVYIYRTDNGEPVIDLSTSADDEETGVAEIVVNNALTLTATPYLNGGTTLSNLQFQVKIGENGTWTNITGDGAQVASPESGTAYQCSYTPTTTDTYYFRATVSDNDGKSGTSEVSGTGHVVSVVSTLTTFTLILADKSGAEVYRATNVVRGESTDPLPNEIRSPFVSAYHYYNTAEDAQACNSNYTAWTQKVIYVGYDVVTGFSGDKAIISVPGDQYLHLNYDASSTNTEEMHNTFRQNRDQFINNASPGTTLMNVSNTMNASNYPFIDNNFVWQLGNDPYNVKIKNKATGRHISEPSNSDLYQYHHPTDAAEAKAYSLIYWNGTVDANNYCSLKRRDAVDKPYLNFNTGTEGHWAAVADGTSTYTKLSIVDLSDKEVQMHIHKTGSTDDEVVLQAYYVAGTKMHTFTPYYLWRACTSNHQFYYDSACNDPITYSTAETSVSIDNTKLTTNMTDSKYNVYVTYDLSTDWSTSNTNGFSTKLIPFNSGDEKIHWFALKSDNYSTYLAVDESATAKEGNGNALLTFAASTNKDDTKHQHWAFIGTPYKLQIVNRYYGTSRYLGTAADAAPSSNPSLMASDGGNTTWEVLGYQSSATSTFFFRLQKSYNGEAPYLCLANAATSATTHDMQVQPYATGYGFTAREIESTPANSITFKLYDGSGVTVGLEDITVVGVSGGDNLIDHFNTTTMPRRYCDYTFYTESTFENTATTATSNSTQTYYVKWDYSADAPVFSTGSDVRDYQYYIMTVCASGSNYPYVIGVDDDGSGGFDFKIDQNIGSIREHKHQFALVGNPYSFKLYSRYASQYVGTPDQSDLLIDGNAEHDAVFDMQVPVSEMNIAQFVARLKGTTRVVTGNSTDVWIGTANQGFLTLRDIIIPVHVFKEGMTEEANQMDYREYAMDLTTHLSTEDRITDSQLTETGNAVGTAHDFRHAFCDYTFYRSYNWSTGTLSNAIPDEGLPYYGGKDQWKRQFFATYTVDHDGFDQIYLIKGSDGEGIYIGKNTESTHGYTLKGVNSKTNAKNDDTRSYRWQFTGDPYNLQIVNVGLGEFSTNYPLAVKAVSDGSQTVESEDAGTLALLTEEIPESSSDTESYGQFSHWEIIAKSDGNYVFWNIDEGEELRYTKSLDRRYSSGNGGVVRMLASENEMVIELPIERYAVTWHVMENNGSNSYTQVATAQVIVDENSTVVLDDMPASLKRHFCEYNQMYSDATCATAITSNSVTVTAATDVYLPYTLDSGAPDFLSATPTASTAEEYWYEIGYPEVSKYIYYDTTNGVSSQNATSVSALRDFANYQYCRWALVGSPYSVKFYNKETETYLTSDGDALTMGGEGTAFTLYDDYSGNLCAIYDAATGTYINASAMLQTYNGAGGTAADFSNTYGVVKIKFVLHYSNNTLRKYDTNDNNDIDDETVGSAAGETETITVDSYQKLDKALDDVLPKAWKRAFCRYSYDWGETSTVSTPSGTTVTTVSQSMVDIYNSNKDEYLYVHVTYDYTTDSPFQWSSTTTDYTGKHWYYLVNNHRPNGILGKMVHRDSDPKLRISTDLVSDQLYLNNYEWCVIGDPYGFKMLNRYDPDQRFDEYISVTTDVDDSSGKYMFKQTASSSQHLFEMMPGQYNYNFWIHPVYSVSTMGEPTDGYDELSYMGQNSNGSAAILMTSTANALRTNSAANYRLERRSDATLKEYLNYAGMVGSLKYNVANNKELVVGDATVDVAAIKVNVLAGTATDEEKTMLHDLINDPDNIVQMVQGYYRLIPYTWEKNKSERRYVRGYLDDQERTNSGDMNSNLKVETLSAAEYDPASIFWFNDTEEAGTNYPRYYVKTQGLSLTGNGLGTGEGFECRYEDIGAGIMQLKSQSEDNDRHYDYLSCAGGDETSTNHCFDEQNGLYKTRFYLQPVGTGGNELPFKMKMNKGHLESAEDSKLAALPYTYTSIYVPYDLLIPENVDIEAFIGTTEHYYSKRTDAADTYYDQDEYALVCHSIDMHQTVEDNDKNDISARFIPAETPVIFRSKSGVTDVTFTIPTNAPSESTIPENTNTFKGTYLKTTNESEQIRIFGRETNATTKKLTGRVGLFPRQSTSTPLTNNKVYYIQKDHSSDASRKGIFFDFDDDGETGIVTAQSRIGNGAYYDLQGRKLKHTTKPGIYIVNGRKMVFK